MLQSRDSHLQASEVEKLTDRIRRLFKNPFDLFLCFRNVSIDVIKISDSVAAAKSAATSELNSASSEDNYTDRWEIRMIHLECTMCDDRTLCKVSLGFSGLTIVWRQSFG